MFHPSALRSRVKDDKSNRTRGVECGVILTEICRVGVVVLSYEHNQLKTAVNTTAQHTSLCQQNVENIIPTYVHGTVIPEMSDLMYRRSESESIGMLFKFHGSLEYGFIGCVSRVGIALPDAKKKIPLSTFFHPTQRNEGSLPSVCGRMHISTILNFHRFMR